MNPTDPTTPGPLLPTLGGVSLPGIETELQKMLIDERMRCEHHKTNYQTLKAEHTRLQDEYARVQSELKRLLNETRSTQEQLQRLLTTLQGELLDKTREVEELKLQVLSPQKLELLRAQIQQELEAPAMERFNKLEEEAERYRSEFNKLRYDYTLLRSDFDHQKEKHAREVEEVTLRCDAEVCRLEKDKEELRSQLQSSDPVQDGKRMQTLLREKAQLHRRLKGLEAEVAELRAERDSCGAQAENVQRVQLRQLAESQAAVKALEAEKQSLRKQMERLDGELRLSHEQNSELTTRLHKAERAVNALSSKVETMKHSHKLEVASVKLESGRARGELERERDGLQSQLEGLQSDLEALKDMVERNKEHLAEMEREVIRKVQAARQEELHRVAALQEEKLELENHLSGVEQQRALQEAAVSSQKEEWDEQLRAARLNEETARKEVQTLRTRLQQHILQLELLEKEKAESGDLRRQNQELTVQLGTLSRSESELLEMNQRLRQTLDGLRDELRGARAQADRAQQEAEKALEQRCTEWLQEKQVLQEREAQLEARHSQARERLHRAALAQKKRKTMNEQKEKKLQEKIQLLQAKIEQMEIESSVAKKRVHSEERGQLQRRLKELQRRHSEFRQLLMGTQYAAGAPHSAALPATQPSFLSHTDDQHQRELSLLRGRLEELESTQQQQLEELSGPLERHEGTASLCDSQADL